MKFLCLISFCTLLHFCTDDQQKKYITYAIHQPTNQPTNQPLLAIQGLLRYTGGGVSLGFRRGCYKRERHGECKHDGFRGGEFSGRTGRFLKIHIHVLVVGGLRIMEFQWISCWILLGRRYFLRADMLTFPGDRWPGYIKIDYLENQMTPHSFILPVEMIQFDYSNWSPFCTSNQFST